MLERGREIQKEREREGDQWTQIKNEKEIKLERGRKLERERVKVRERE